VFNNYYEETSHVIFGCRFNLIKKDFESLLSSLKSAGAELIFVSKKNYSDNMEDVCFEYFDETYKRGLEFVKFIENGKSSVEVSNLIININAFKFYF
jgi:hypothetical protein